MGYDIEIVYIELLCSEWKWPVTYLELETKSHIIYMYTDKYLWKIKHGGGKTSKSEP